MNDPIPHPVASILFGLAVVALLLWQGSEGNRLAKHSAQFLSRLTEGPQVARLPQQIHSVPMPLQAEAEIKPKPTTKIYYRVMSRCAFGGTDLSTWMVRQGWAKPNDPPEPALADAAEGAKSERIGLWRGAEYDSIRAGL